MKRIQIAGIALYIAGMLAVVAALILVLAEWYVAAGIVVVMLGPMAPVGWWLVGAADRQLERLPVGKEDM